MSTKERITLMNWTKMSRHIFPVITVQKHSKMKWIKIFTSFLRFAGRLKNDFRVRAAIKDSHPNTHLIVISNVSTPTAPRNCSEAITYLFSLFRLYFFGNKHS